MSIYQATFEVPTYGDYEFSTMSVLLGWTYSFSSILPIPLIYIYYRFFKDRGGKKPDKPGTVWLYRVWLLVNSSV